MPKGAEILSVAAQGSDICMWARVDPDAALEPRYFSAFATGQAMPATGVTFIGTVLLQGGGLVFHVFEVDR